MYSRWWGGWAAGEAGTVGWTPRRSASSPSTASWTDPSWLRPLASWVTRGSVSDRPQLSRTGCESHKPADGKVSNHLPPWKAGGRRRRAAVSWERVQFNFACALLRTNRGRWADLWGVSVRWVPETPFSNLKFDFHVFDSRAMRYKRDPCPPPPGVWCWVQHQVRLPALLLAWIGMLINPHFAPPSQAAFRPIRDELSLHKCVGVCMCSWDAMENGILHINRLRDSITR